MKKINPIPPYMPKPVTITKRADAVKPATPDLFIPLRSDIVPIDTMADMIFEDIGGQEIINILNGNLIGDFDIEYQPVKDLRDIYLRYDPAALNQFYDSSSAYFNSFAISLDSYLANEDLIINTGYAITSPEDGQKQKISIVNAVADGENVTYELGANHGLQPNDRIFFYNINPISFNTSINNPDGDLVLFTPTENKVSVANTTTELYAKSTLIYIDPSNGDLVIDLKDIPSGFNVEVEIWEPDKYFDTDRMLNGEPAPKPLP